MTNTQTTQALPFASVWSDAPASHLDNVRDVLACLSMFLGGQTELGDFDAPGAFPQSSPARMGLTTILDACTTQIGTVSAHMAKTPSDKAATVTKAAYEAFVGEMLDLNGIEDEADRQAFALLDDGKTWEQVADTLKLPTSKAKNVAFKWSEMRPTTEAMRRAVQGAQNHAA